MRNLYSMTKSQQAIREGTAAMVDRAGHSPLLSAIGPLADGALILGACGKEDEIGLAA